MGKTKIYEDANGNTSSTRIIGMVVIGTMIIYTGAILAMAILNPTQSIALIGVGAGFFSTTTAPTFIFLYNNKKEELLTYFNKKNGVADVTTPIDSNLESPIK
jgi:ABC-type Fe3+-siderophore transport system permease subunit